MKLSDIRNEHMSNENDSLNCCNHSYNVLLVTDMFWHQHLNKKWNYPSFRSKRMSDESNSVSRCSSFIGDGLVLNIFKIEIRSIFYSIANAVIFVVFKNLKENN